MKILQWIDFDIRGLSAENLDALKQSIGLELERRKAFVPSETEVLLARQGKKIQAIKAFRDRVQCSLTDAKNTIDLVK